MNETVNKQQAEQALARVKRVLNGTANPEHRQRLGLVAGFLSALIATWDRE